MAERNPDRPARLDAAFVKSVLTPGRYSDGAQAFGLSLLVRATTRGGVTKRFQQRLRRDGKVTNVAVGTWPVTTLAEARELALDNARYYRKGNRLPPVSIGIEREPEPVKMVPTFTEIAEQYIQENAAKWRNAKTAASWRARFEMYTYTAIGDRRIDTITTSDVLAILRPHWLDKGATMRKLSQTLDKVFSYAVAWEHIASSPISSKVVQAGLGKAGSGTTHYQALPYKALAEAIDAIREADAPPTARLALEFVALTACRSGEVRGAIWAEFNLDAETWTIPAHRMKRNKPHTVLLSSGALDVLRIAERHRDDSGLVFPSIRGGQIHDATLSQLLRSLGLQSTVHGMRASYKGWAAETGIDNLLSEIALAHAIGDATFQAYMRSDLVEQRRSMMQQWSDVLVGADAFEV